MSVSVTSVVNHFPTANKGFITTTSSTFTSGVAQTTVPLTSVSGLTNATIFVGILAPGTSAEREFTGTVDTAGSQITGVKWTDGSDATHTAGTTIVDYVSATGQNMQTKALIRDHNQSGYHKTLNDDSGNEWIKQVSTASAVNEFSVANAATGTGPVLSATGGDTNIDINVTPKGSGQVVVNGRYDGWALSALPAVSSVTYNGNRSYDITFASTVASILSSGMRLRTTRTVAGQGYMGGAFNGSSHYFTKATPSGTLGTVTNNFTIEAWIQPTTYASGYICGRADATPNNWFGLFMLNTGQIQATIGNGGTANVRTVTTYQSVALNKKTHVAMSWTGGTVVIYFDGVSVPVGAASTGGTAPTTAGTGGDWSIGRLGAYNATYQAGYISNVAVFDAVLTAATIKQHSTYILTGSETNCIGAWSLNNVATDASAGANNLTATGGVGYSSTVSPMGNNGASTTLDYALVQAVSTTVATVQVPEGCTIPTSGGVTSVAYSVQGNPFGFPASIKNGVTLSSLGLASQGSITTAETDIYSTYITATVGSQIKARLTLNTEMFSTVAADFLKVRLYEGSTLLRTFEAPVQTANGQQNYNFTHDFVTTAGTNIYKATLVRGSGTGTLSTFGSSALIEGTLMTLDLSL